MIRYLAALVTATLAGVAGVWLVLAPAALGYPGRRVYGSVVSRVDLATGAGLCVVALVTGVVWAIAWRRRLRADGVLPLPRTTRAVRPAPVPEEAQTQVIPVPAQLRTTTEPAAHAPAAHAPAAAGPGTAPATAPGTAPATAPATAPGTARADVAPGGVASPFADARREPEEVAPVPFSAASGAAAVPAAEAPLAGVTAPDGTLADGALPDGAVADEAPAAAGAGSGGDAGVSDLRALLAPLVDALAEDVWRTRETAGVGGCAGRAGDDYAEETW